MFAVDTQAIYVELSDSAGRKRYLLPNELTTMGKLKALLTKYPQLSLVRQGIAGIKSGPDKSELDTIMEIEHLPVKVDALYRVHMPDHPDTVDNFARFSEGLIKLVNEESEVSQMQTAVASSSSSSLTDQLKAQLPSSQQADISLSSGSGPSLTDSLKQQVAQQKADKRPQAPAAPVAPPAQQSGGSSAAPWVEHLPRRLGEVLSEQGETEIMEHEEYVEKHLEEQYEILLQIIDELSALHDKVDAIGIRIIAPQQGEPITGKQLQTWFAESAAKVGFEQAFEALAMRLAGENPDAV